MSTARAAALPVGAQRGRARPGGGREVAQPAGRRPRTASARSGRSVKTPVTPSAVELGDPRLVVHRVDGRLEAGAPRGLETAPGHALVPEADRPGAARPGGSRRRSRRAAPCARPGAASRASSSAARWKQTSTSSSRSNAERAPNGVAARPLQLDHHADAAVAEIEHLGERRVADAAARRVVGDAEVVVHVELDEVGADLDRTLERGQRVLGQIGRRAAVRDDEHQPSRRRITPTSMRSISSSARARRCGSSVPRHRRARGRRPAARADAIPASVSSKTAVVRRGRRRAVAQRLQVPLRVRLPVDDVVGGDDAAQQRGEPGRLDDRARSPRGQRPSRSRAARAPRRSGPLRVCARGRTSRRRPRPGSASTRSAITASTSGWSRPSHVRTISGSERPASSSKYSCAESGLPCSAKRWMKISQRIGSSSESVPLKSKIRARVGHRVQDRSVRGMTTTALLLALAAAVVHAVWNVLLARARDPQSATAVALLTAEVVFAVAGVPHVAHGRRRSGRTSSPAARCSSSTSRCSSPPTGCCRSRSSTRSRAGSRRCSCSCSASPCSVTRRRSARCSASAWSAPGSCSSAACGRPPERGVVFGLVIACVIATYTLVDKQRRSPMPAALSYLELSMLAPALLYASYVGGTQGAACAARRGHSVDPRRRHRHVRRLLPRAARAPAGSRGAGRRGPRDERRRDSAPRRPLPRRAGRRAARRGRRGRRLRDRARLARVVVSDTCGVRHLSSRLSVCPLVLALHVSEQLVELGALELARRRGRTSPSPSSRSRSRARRSRPGSSPRASSRTSTSGPRGGHGRPCCAAAGRSSAPTSSSSWASDRLDSLQMFPSSKAGSLFPEYS